MTIPPLKKLHDFFVLMFFLFTRSDHMQIFSSSLRNLWTTWELPALVLCSLLLQVALIQMGYNRKYTSNVWLRWLLWLAYLSADWVATVSLSILSNYDYGSSSSGCNNNNNGNSPELKNVIRAFWAPFLLLHLGGPDTITAYSMQDNDLWLRHFLGLFVQAGLASYVFLRALQPTAMNFITIPVFVAGIVKYGERTWVLRSSSIDHLRDQLVPISIAGRSIFPTQSPHFSEVRILHVAHGFFQRNKWVFANLVLNIQDLKETLFCFEEYDSETAFKVVELELGFMHDFFYTKASIIHSYPGAFLRLITSSSIAAAIIATFCTSHMHKFPPTDMYLTFFLLFGALGLEIYSFILLLRSDWCIIWLTKIDNFLARLTFKAICGSGWSIGKRRWSNSVAQYNLISRCLEDINGGFSNFLKTSYITQIMDSQPISDELKKRIFQHLKEKAELEDQDQSTRRPDWIVKKHSLYECLGWSLELDSDQSILLWHIATNLCYHSDHKSSVTEDGKLLSDFLAYILVTRHSLFPNGMSQTRLHATAKKFIDFLRIKSEYTVVDACKSALLSTESKPYEPEDVKEKGSSSVFDHGCLLARQLRDQLEEDERWEMIGHVWVEMLADVSRECKSYDHIEQLRDGGDLLTHVWLLMHHLGYAKGVYNVTTALQESEIKEFSKDVRSYNVVDSPRSRRNYLRNYLEKLE